MDGKYDREVLELGVQGLPVVDDIQIAAAAAASDFEHSTSTTSSPYTSSSSSDDDDGNDDENIMAPTYLHRPGHQGRCFGNAHTSQEKVQSSCRVRLEAVQEGRIALQINVQSGSGRAVGYADLSSDSLSNVSSSSDDNEEEEEEEEEIELESDTEEIQDYGEIRRIIDAMDGEIEESATFPPAASELFGSVPPPQLETFSILSDEPLSEAGQIMSVIEGTIVVRASSGSRALDEGSILVLEDRTVLGVIEDIFGPVQAPLYALRCSSQVNDNVKPQAKVFSVDRLAQFVLPDQLRVKGYDDGEMVNGEESVQQDEAHFSDDEAEAAYRRKLKAKRKSEMESLHGQNKSYTLNSNKISRKRRNPKGNRLAYGFHNGNSHGHPSMAQGYGGMHHGIPNFPPRDTPPPVRPPPSPAHLHSHPHQFNQFNQFHANATAGQLRAMSLQPHHMASPYGGMPPLNKQQNSFRPPPPPGPPPPQN